MNRVLTLVAGSRLARPEDHHARAWPALLASAGMHALVLGCVVAWTFVWWHRLPEPMEPPTVDVVVDGGGAKVTGVRAVEATPPAPTAPPVAQVPPAAPPPAPSPPMQTTTAAVVPPSAEAPEQEAPPAPPPPQIEGETPVPPAAQATPTAELPAAAPPPQPKVPPMEPPPAPTPPPTQMASLTPPAPDAEASPEVRLGDGTAGPLAEILNDDGIIRRAKAADGNMPPAYPLDAARRGEHGTVTLRLTIGTAGEVLEAEVAKSSGSPRLDRAAREQIATWHFSPAMRDGKPQIDVIELGVDFQLD